jgi:hypothetical protein
LQSDLVDEHVWRGIDLNVHGAPEGDPYSRVIWLCVLLSIHESASFRR